MPVAPVRLFRWDPEGSYRARRRVKRPGPASGLVLLGDPPSFDEDGSDPHCCVQALRCSCLCRRLRRPAARRSRRLAAGLLFGGDGVAARLFSPDVRGCLPGHRHHLARHDSVGLDRERGNRPVVPRENRKVSRSAVLPCVGCPCGPALWPPGASPESPLPPRNTAAWRVRADGVHLPMRSAILDASASQWHLGVGLHELWLPRRAGFPPAVRAYPV